MTKKWICYLTALAFICIMVVMVGSCAAYTVSYDANGGSFTPPSEQSGYNANDYVIVSGVYDTWTWFTKTGSAISGSGITSDVFLGWNTATDGSGTQYMPGEVLTINNDTTLYAQWGNLRTGITTYGNFRKYMNNISGNNWADTSPYAIRIDGNFTMDSNGQVNFPGNRIIDLNGHRIILNNTNNSCWIGMDESNKTVIVDSNPVGEGATVTKGYCDQQGVWHMSNTVPSGCTSHDIKGGLITMNSLSSYGTSVMCWIKDGQQVVFSGGTIAGMTSACMGGLFYMDGYQRGTNIPAKLTITGGNIYGNKVVRNNDAGNGGAVANLMNNSQVFMTGGTVANNVYYYNPNDDKQWTGGGAFRVDGIAGNNTLYLYGGTVMNNSCRDINNKESLVGRGGAIFIWGEKEYNTTQSVIIKGNVTIDGNKAKYGGAIGMNANIGLKDPTYFNGTLNLDIDSNKNQEKPVIKNNVAGEEGGLLWMFKDENAPNAKLVVSLKDVNISGNSAVKKGGAVYQSTGTLTISGSTEIKNNRVTGGDGGAIYLDSGTITLQDSVNVKGNTASGNGGAIYLKSETMTLQDSVIVNGNNASGDGGAIYLKSGTMTLQDSVIVNGNNASNNGGGFYMNDGILTMNGNVSISGNTATKGNGFFMNGAKEVNLKESATFGDNDELYLSKLPKDDSGDEPGIKATNWSGKVMKLGLDTNQLKSGTLVFTVSGTPDRSEVLENVHLSDTSVWTLELGTTAGTIVATKNLPKILDATFTSVTYNAASESGTLGGQVTLREDNSADWYELKILHWEDNNWKEVKNVDKTILNPEIAPKGYFDFQVNMANGELKEGDYCLSVTVGKNAVDPNEGSTLEQSDSRIHIISIAPQITKQPIVYASYFETHDSSLQPLTVEAKDCTGGNNVTYEWQYSEDGSSYTSLGRDGESCWPTEDNTKNGKVKFGVYRVKVINNAETTSNQGITVGDDHGYIISRTSLIERKNHILYYNGEKYLESLTPDSYETDIGVTLPTSVDVKGYTFENWYKDSALTTQILQIVPGTTGDVDIYGKFSPKSYTITLDANGGTGGTTNITVTYDSSDLETITVPNPPSGKTFVGWYTSKNGGDQIISENGSFVSSIADYTDKDGKWIKDSNTTLYAHWSNGGTHTVTVNPGNHGSGGSASPASASEGQEVTLTPPTAQEGWKFTGWKSDPSISIADNKFKMPGSNITVTAQYTEKHTVTVNQGNHGSDGSASPASAFEGDEITLIPPTADLGWIFSEWTSSPTVKIIDDKFTMPASAVTVTAQYTEKTKYAVTVNPGDHGSGGSASPASVSEGQEVTLTPPTAQEGWKFTGWTSSPSVTITTDNKFTMPASAVTVTAQYAEKTIHSVTVLSGEHGNDASASPASAYEEQKITLIPPTVDDGWKFSGWFSSPSVTITDNKFTMPDSDLTVTAQYIQKVQKKLYFSNPEHITLKVLVDGTEVSSGSDVWTDAKVVVTATSTDGYEVPTLGWSISGTVSNTSKKKNSLSFTMGETDVTVSATAQKAEEKEKKEFAADQVSTVYKNDNSGKLVFKIADGKNTNIAGKDFDEITLTLTETGGSGSLTLNSDNADFVQRSGDIFEIFIKDTELLKELKKWKGFEISGSISSEDDIINIDNVKGAVSDTALTVLLSHRSGEPIDLTKVNVIVTTASNQTFTFKAPTNDPNVGRYLEAGEILNVGYGDTFNTLLNGKIVPGAVVDVQMVYNNRYVIYEGKVKAK